MLKYCLRLYTCGCLLQINLFFKTLTYVPTLVFLQALLLMLNLDAAGVSAEAGNHLSLFLTTPGNSANANQVLHKLVIVDQVSFVCCFWFSCLSQPGRC